MSTLKPCPFCGAPENWLRSGTVDGPIGFEYQYIACTLCGGAMIDGNSMHSSKDLRKHWNRRDERNKNYDPVRDPAPDPGYGWRAK